MVIGEFPDVLAYLLWRGQQVIGEEIDNLVRCKGYAVTWALGIRSNVGST